MIVIRDSREQHGYRFEGYPETAVVRGTLRTGDYAPQGYEDRCAVERKSLPDLVACLGRERDRFTRGLERARGLDAFMVVVEAPWSDLATGNYRSAMNPHAACQSILSMTGKYGTPFLFAGSRAGSEYAAWGFLRQYLEGSRKRLEAILKAAGDHDQGRAGKTQQKAA